jgi:hypothetical protein
LEEMQGAKNYSATTDLVTIANRAAAAAAAAGQSGLNPGHHGMATNYEMSGMLMCSISVLPKFHQELIMPV